jgi:hypothetical protein
MLYRGACKNDLDLCIICRIDDDLAIRERARDYVDARFRDRDSRARDRDA